MPLNQLWTIYQAEGYAGVCRAEISDPLAHFYRALLAFGEDDIPQALASTRDAARLHPENPVFAEAARYLDRVQAEGKAQVYIDGEAFAAFIRGGGNVGLYEACSEALHGIYEEFETLRLLDVGVGDGLALLPALTSNMTRLDLIEPSEAMLGRTTATLKRWGVNYVAHPSTFQEFIETGGNVAWDVIQATWSLQSIPPDDRPAAFAWMRQHGARALVAEFDVPAFSDMYGPDRVRYVVGRYWRGLAEYEGDGGRVAQGFLMPVMFGYFDRSASRTNWEGPIQGWIDGLHAAGFEHVRRQKLYEYFWADAILLDAQ